ncbi:hypothetical protein OH76DRAFT_1488754 [Lentinus brumalis]|uniref:RlpA-like protein double-psi beta-barrel domain-containing protein n=1 Tax=Lentinus brumalis TaxID=2498619 RepID=A0A371CPU7_9APHY|nr:hypothetical protein OH76DRAFT_1488754 [Polyporus brumalis]
MRCYTLFFAVISAATFGCAQTISGGDATFHSSGLGSCGKSYSDADFVVAVDHATMSKYAGTITDPMRNPLCGRQMVITSPDNKVITVTVEDTCVTCSVGSVDLTRGAFQALAPLSVGIIHGISWTLV